ncbi:hypothetical protein [Candidatus Nitrosocosmicus hydrocola]|nr:hypothetical protein [Candidatus Nitrosocosmicus hydrocola]
MQDLYSYNHKEEVSYPLVTRTDKIGPINESQLFSITLINNESRWG